MVWFDVVLKESKAFTILSFGNLLFENYSKGEQLILRKNTRSYGRPFLLIY